MHTIWVLPEPSSEKVKEQERWFLKVVELSEKDVRVELEGWMASAIVVRSLNQKVFMEVVAREFQLRLGLKGEVSSYGLEQGHFLFHFKVVEERDLILR